MRSRIRLVLLSIVAVVTSAISASYPPANLTAQLFPDSPVETGLFTGWQRVSAKDFEGYKLLWGQPLEWSGRSADDLVSLVAGEFGIPSQFSEIRSHSTPTRDYRIYRETRDGLPVIGGRMTLALNRQNELSRITYMTFQNWPSTGSFSLTPFVAASYLQTTLEKTNWQVVDSQSFACWYPDVGTQELRAAYWLKIAGPRPHQRHAGVVDAQSGEVLLEWSGISHEVIDLSIVSPYWQPYDHSPRLEAPSLFQNVRINGESYFTDTAGMVSAEAGNQANIDAALRGRYVEVGEQEEGATPEHSFTISSPFSDELFPWNEDHASRPALNLYYHTQFIHDWVKILDSNYDALDYPMPAVANYGGPYDNAFWNGWGTFYGGGMNYGNFGMYSDVIYHEYEHGVTDGIYPDDMLPYIDQPGALNEAWSDYFACSINGDPLMGDWLTGNAHSSFRDLESQMVFPRNWVGEVHGDSPFISAPLWRIRSELGAGYADTLGHFARYGLSELFFDYFVDVLETDDTDGNLENGTPNDVVIYDAFGRHGIGPGIKPNYVIHDLLIDDASGNDNGFVEAGETVIVTFQLINDVVLFPPAATNVMLTANTEDNSIVISNASFSLGTIGPRDTVDVGPITMTVASGTPDHWGVITLSFTSDQFTEPTSFPLEFTVGIPKLHVVTRALETNVHRFVTNTLREMDKIFQLKLLQANQPLNIAALPDTGIVLWLSGDGDGAGMTQNDRELLTNHVSGGGRLVLSGKNILDGIEGTALAQNVLCVDIAGRSRLRMASVIDAPFITGETYLLTGSGGAANQDSMTVLFPLSTSTSVLRFGPTGNNVSAVMGPTHRTLVFGFGIEAVADNNPIGNESRTEFLTRLLEWGDVLSSVENQPNPGWRPDEFTLSSAYPNPFNSSVQLRYSIGNEQDAQLLIYDVLGREAHRAALSSQASTYLWQPDLASGVYFAVLKSATRSTEPQKLLLLR